MKLALISALGLSFALGAAAQTLEKYSASTGKYDVPLEVAKPAHSGPHPPVLYIHARRGLEDEDRAHMRRSD